MSTIQDTQRTDYWMSQVQCFVYSFLEKPCDATKASLDSICKQYREHVEAKQVTPPSIYRPL